MAAHEIVGFFCVGFRREVVKRKDGGRNPRVKAVRDRCFHGVGQPATEGFDGDVERIPKAGTHVS